MHKKKLIIILILLSIAVGFVYVLQHFVEIYKLGEQGQTYYPWSLLSGYDETNTFGPRYKDVADGHLLSSELNLYEYIGYPSYWPILPPLFLGPILFLTQSVTLTAIISSFIFPAAAFLLLFYLFFIITRNKFFSIVAALIFSLFTRMGLLLPPLSLINLKELIKSILPFAAGSDIVGNNFARRESFIPNFIPFCLSFIFSYLSLKKGDIHKLWSKYTVLAGICFGVLSYTYPHHFGYFASGLGIMLLLFLFQKEYANVKKILVIFFVAILTSVFSIINYIKFWSLPQAQDIFERFGPETTHQFRLSLYKEYIIYILLAALVWILGKKKKKKVIATYVIGFLLAGIVVLNIQVITGYNIFPDHWISRSIFFGLNLAWLLLLWWLFDYLKQKEKFRKGIMIALIIFTVFLFTRNLHYQILWSSREFNYSRSTIPSNLMDSFNWLDENTARDSVIMTPSLVTNYFIPLYTHNSIFLAGAHNTLAPDSEILDRLYITYRFFDIPSDYMEKLLDNESNNKAYEELSYEAYENRGFMYFFITKLMDRSLDSYFKGIKLEMPDETYQEIISAYQSYLPTLKDALTKYRLDYIYYGPQERKIIEKEFGQLNYLEKVYDKEGVVIYKVNSQSVID